MSISACEVNARTAAARRFVPTREGVTTVRNAAVLKSVLMAGKEDIAKNAKALKFVCMDDKRANASNAAPREALK